MIGILFWIYHHLQFLYRYQHSSLLWLARYPTWYLVLNTILGIIGFVIGVGQQYSDRFMDCEIQAQN